MDNKTYSVTLPYFGIHRYGCWPFSPIFAIFRYFAFANLVRDFIAKEAKCFCAPNQRQWLSLSVNGWCAGGCSHSLSSSAWLCHLLLSSLTYGCNAALCHCFAVVSDIWWTKFFHLCPFPSSLLESNTRGSVSNAYFLLFLLLGDLVLNYFSLYSNKRFPNLL